MGSLLLSITRYRVGRSTDDIDPTAGLRTNLVARVAEGVRPASPEPAACGLVNVPAAAFTSTTSAVWPGERFFRVPATELNAPTSLFLRPGCWR